MKWFTRLPILFAGIVLAGCMHRSPVPPGAAARSTTAAPAIVTPDNSLTARVVSYNSVGRFVVLSFPVNRMPAMDQTLFLYRNGLKVAEIKVTGPQQDNNTVADLVTGDAQVGDEVHDQ